MRLTERDRLIELLSRWLGPEAAAWQWTRRRHAWGNLTAQELWELGCYETLRAWIYESTEALLQGVMEATPQGER